MRVHVYDLPSFLLVFTKHFKHNLDISCNAELNIVEELTNSRTMQQQQTFMDPTIRGKQNNLKSKGN